MSPGSGEAPRPSPSSAGWQQPSPDHKVVKERHPRQRCISSADCADRLRADACLSGSSQVRSPQHLSSLPEALTVARSRRCHSPHPAHNGIPDPADPTEYRIPLRDKRAAEDRLPRRSHPGIARHRGEKGGTVSEMPSSYGFCRLSCLTLLRRIEGSWCCPHISDHKSGLLSPKEPGIFVEAQGRFILAAREVHDLIAVVVPGNFEGMLQHLGSDPALAIIRMRDDIFDQAIRSGAAGEIGDNRQGTGGNDAISHAGDDIEQSVVSQDGLPVLLQSVINGQKGIIRDHILIETQKLWKVARKCCPDLDVRIIWNSHVHVLT